MLLETCKAKGSVLREPTPAIVRRPRLAVYDLHQEVTEDRRKGEDGRSEIQKALIERQTC